jgi:type I site-specific restriction endonuclease
MVTRCQRRRIARGLIHRSLFRKWLSELCTTPFADYVFLINNKFMPRQHPLEAHTRSQIHVRLQNLGWIFDEKDPSCNVFQEHAKTDAQDKKFGGGKPDYVLYESGTDNPIAVIEAKKPGLNLDGAMIQGEKYARAINAPLDPDPKI